MGIEERHLREKQERIAAILAAAKRLFARRGFQETSMSDIAEACELGKATLYYYFPSKEEIYQEIILSSIREYHRSLEESIIGLQTPVELIEYLAREHLRQAYLDLDFIRLLFPVGKSAPGHLLQHGSVARELQAMRTPIQQKMQELLVKSDTEVDVETFSSLLWSYISGLCHKIVQGYPPEDLQQEVQLFIHIITAYLKRE